MPLLDDEFRLTHVKVTAKLDLDLFVGGNDVFVGVEFLQRLLIVLGVDYVELT